MVARLVIALFVSVSLHVPAWAQGSVEYAVKAAYLYKFGAFVDWPPRRFADAASPLVVCVVGRDPFGARLDRVTTGQTSGGRPVVVRRLETIAADTACHIAFLGGGRLQSHAEAARALRGAPVLTVGDSDDAPTIVRFVIVSNRVRFVIDQRAAAEAGLPISSKLLNLAVGAGR